MISESHEKDMICYFDPGIHLNIDLYFYPDLDPGFFLYVKKDVSIFTLILICSGSA